MATTLKQAELERNKAIALAILDYLQNTSGRLILDEIDPEADNHRQIRQFIEESYQKKNLRRIQQIIRQMTEGLRMKADRNFGIYIKEKTGNDLDIFENLQERFDKIMEQQKITSEQEIRDAMTMISTYRQTPGNQEKIDLLAQWTTEYHKQKSSQKNSAVITERQLTTVFESNSPDGKCRLLIAEDIANAENPMTRVLLVFDLDGGSIYAVPGINLGISVHWEDNNTVVIETKKDYSPVSMHKQVQRLGDMISIKYIER
jgi:hypothetical protein